MADLQTLDLILFAAGTFAAALVTGVAGFAFGIVAAAVWLYFLPPAQTTALIVAYGLIVQGISVWKLRRSIQAGPAAAVFARRGDRRADRRRAAALDLAGDPAHFGRGRADAFQPLQPGAAAARAGAGRQGGGRGESAYSTALSAARPGSPGSSSRSGARLRGWPRDEQRAAFQPIGVGVFLMTGLWLGGLGLVSADTLRLFVIGLPAAARRNLGRATALCPA